MKHLWTWLIVAALSAVLATGVYAQRYTPPGGSTETGDTGGGGGDEGSGGDEGGSVDESGGEEADGTNPDPFGLTLAASGTAAAVGYVMRRRRREES